MAGNTRFGRGAHNNPNPPPPPSPATLEQILAVQTQLMQTMVQHMQNQPAAEAPPVPPRDKHGEFMKGHPPTFAHSSDPLEVDDSSEQWRDNLLLLNAMNGRRCSKLPDNCEEQHLTSGNLTSMGMPMPTRGNNIQHTIPFVTKTKLAYI